VSGHGAAANEDDEPEIHLPPPSFSPALIALGVMLISFGVLATPALIVAGGVILLAGIVTWLIDDARTFAAAGESDGGHGASHGTAGH
jgi:hypothetical protein